MFPIKTIQNTAKKHEPVRMKKDGLEDGKRNDDPTLNERVCDFS